VLSPPTGEPARVVRLGDGPGEVRSPELAAWLGGRSVLVRPDRIVAATSRRAPAREPGRRVAGGVARRRR
jgi:hypothetical protein